MIGKLSGTLLEYNGTTALIDTASGLAYQVTVAPDCIATVTPGSPISLLIYHHIREDQQVLFGFSSADLKEFFILLLSVPGVGPKTAFSISSRVSFAQALEAVSTHDEKPFSTIPGVGKKTALKILVELSSKLKKDLSVSDLFSTEDKTLLEALSSLGYGPKEAKEMIKSVPKGGTLEQRITKALQRAAPPL